MNQKESKPGIAHEDSFKKAVQEKHKIKNNHCHDRSAYKACKQNLNRENWLRPTNQPTLKHSAWFLEPKNVYAT